MCILVRHWRAIHTKVVRLVLDLWWVAEKTRLNTCANNKGADQPEHPCRLISVFVVRCSSVFFDEEASHKLKWRTEWYLEFISFSQNLSFQGYSALWSCQAKACIQLVPKEMSKTRSKRNHILPVTAGQPNHPVPLYLKSEKNEYFTTMLHVIRINQNIVRLYQIN